MNAEGLEQARRALDRAVAEAADAWVNDARDHEAYRRLVAAVLTRRANLQPALDLDVERAEQPEIDDDLADRSPFTAMGEGLDPRDPGPLSIYYVGTTQVTPEPSSAARHSPLGHHEVAEP